MSWLLDTWSTGQGEKQRDKIFAVVLWLIARLLLMVSTLAMSGFAHLFYMATIWAGVHDDSAWFLSIAQTGYWLQTTPFFPLYPMIIRIFHMVFHAGYTESGLIISNVFFILDLYLFVRLGRKMQNARIGYLAAILFAFFPTGFFDVGLYTESLFIFGVLLCLYAVELQRLPLASLAASIATLTRNEGIMLLIPMAFYAWSVRKEQGKRAFGWLLVPCASLGTYLAFLWFRFGNPLIFAGMEKLWGRVHTFPLWTIVGGIEASIHTIMIGNWYEKAYYSLNLGAVMLVLLSIVYVFRHFPKHWAVLVLIMALLPLSAPGIGMETIMYQPRHIEDYFFSFDRFVLPMVPIFFALAKRVLELRVQRFVVPACMVSLSIMGTPITQHIFFG